MSATNKARAGSHAAQQSATSTSDMTPHKGLAMPSFRPHYRTLLLLAAVLAPALSHAAPYNTTRYIRIEGETVG